MSVCQVFQTTFTVVIPSKDCSKCEEYQAEHQDKCCQFLRKRKSVLECICSNLHAFNSLYLPCTCQNNGKTCHSTDNDRINESTCHTDQPLTYRLFCLCCCCCDRCTTKTCFIGEDSSCNTFLHCNDHGTNHTTGYCTWVKCGFDNCYNCCRNFCNVADDQCNTEHDIDHCHKWYDNLADSCNSFQSTDQNRCYTECKNQRRNNNCYRILSQERDIDTVCLVRIKEVLYGTGNTIYLAECTNTEKSYTNTEECKDLAKPFPFWSHTFFDIIEWSAKAVSVFCNHTVFNCQKTFRKFCCHSKECCHDHPEKCSRTTGTDCCCYTYDITGTDRSTQCCTQCRKTGDLTISLFFILEHPFQRQWKTTYLKEPKSAGKKNATGYDQYHKRYAPDLVIHCN